jgi:hypothetical protein
MNANADLDKFHASITDQREKLGLPALDVDLLYAKVGSQDVEVATQAKKTLLLKWELTAERDAKNAKTVDLMKDDLSRYPEPIRQKIVSKATVLQLTQNCNGNCYGCPNGKDKGVSAKYSFNSIVSFFQTYHDSLPDDFRTYWQSDPFDYRDGDHNFTDVYKAFREIRPEQFQSISTALPRGSADDFIDFVKNLAYEKRDFVSQGKKLQTKVRISVWKHNIQRVEAIVNKCMTELSQEGFSDEELILLFNHNISFENRFDDMLRTIGPLISRRDDMTDVEAIACEDTIVLSPENVYATTMTVPTVFDPMGEQMIPITAENCDRVIPEYVYKPDYARSSNYFTEKLATPFLPKLISTDKKELELDDPIDSLCMHLGRSILSFGLVLENLEHLPITVEPIGTKNPVLTEENKTKYFATVFEEYPRMKDLALKQIQHATALVKQSEEIQQDKIQYYILLAEVYLSKMDYLATLFVNEIPFEVIGATAGVIKNIGRKEIGQFDDIVSQLNRLIDQIQRGEIDTYFVEQGLDEQLMDKYASIFHFTNETKPTWFVNLCSWYAGWAEKSLQQI